VSSFFVAALAVNFIGLILDVWLFRATRKGTVLESNKREVVRYLAPIRVFYSIIDVVVCIFGIIAVSISPKGCIDFGDAIVLRVLIIVLVSLGALGSLVQSSIQLGCYAVGVRSAARHGVNPDADLRNSSRRWARCCQVCCCRPRSEAHSETFQIVGAVLATIFEAAHYLNLTTSDLAAGLMLVRAKQKDEEREALEKLLPVGPAADSGNQHDRFLASTRTVNGFLRWQYLQHLVGSETLDLSSSQTEDFKILDEAAHYAAHALGSYGWLLYAWQRIWTFPCVLSFWWTLYNFAVLLQKLGCPRRILGLRSEDVNEANPLTHAHYRCVHGTGTGDPGVRKFYGCDSVALRRSLRKALLHDAEIEERRAYQTAQASDGPTKSIPFSLRFPGFLRTSIFRRCDILHVSTTEAYFNTPWLVTVDRGRKALVVAVRGSLSADDAITDVFARPTDALRDLEEFGWDEIPSEAANVARLFPDAHTASTPASANEKKAARARRMLSDIRDSMESPGRREPLLVHDGMWRAAKSILLELQRYNLLELAAGRGLAVETSLETIEQAASVRIIREADKEILRSQLSSRASDEARGPETGIKMRPRPRGHSRPKREGKISLPSAPASRDLFTGCVKPGHGTLDLVICGHSLGAGVAALLSLLLRPYFNNLRCFCFAPPGGLVSPALSRLMRAWTVSVIVGKDIIPRASVFNFQKLLSEAVLALSRCKVNKADVMRAPVLSCFAQCCPIVCQPCFDPTYFPTENICCPQAYSRWLYGRLLTYSPNSFTLMRLRHQAFQRTVDSDGVSLERRYMYTADEVNTRGDDDFSLALRALRCAGIIEGMLPPYSGEISSQRREEIITLPIPDERPVLDIPQIQSTPHGSDSAPSDMSSHDQATRDQAAREKELGDVIFRAATMVGVIHRHSKSTDLSNIPAGTLDVLAAELRAEEGTGAPKTATTPVTTRPAIVAPSSPARSSASIFSRSAYLHRMQMPGRPLHLVEISKENVDRPTRLFSRLFGLCGCPSLGLILSTIFCFCFRRRVRKYEPRWTSVESFDRVLVSLGMLWDHMPEKVFDVLQEVRRGLSAPQSQVAKHQQDERQPGNDQVPRKESNEGEDGEDNDDINAAIRQQPERGLRMHVLAKQVVLN
jgi:hypothetical protein